MKKTVTVTLFALILLLSLGIPVQAQVFDSVPCYGPSCVMFNPAIIKGTPTVTIAGVTIASSTFPTSTVRSGHFQFKFGTVAGSYGTCTVQLQTTYDGTTWLTLGSAASVTVTTNTVNAWSVLEQDPSTSAVTTSAPSATVALGYGRQSRFLFACSSYGTSAPVTISVNLK